jgi:hydrogenase/urease accessory protein HupE
MKRGLFLLLLLFVTPGWAHEVRPAYLELHEIHKGEFQVMWKVPMRGDRRLALTPAFSGRTHNSAPMVTVERNGAAVQTWRVMADDPLRGQSVRIVGLEGTMTDTLVRLEFTDGTNWVKRLTPAEPSAVIPAQPHGWSVAGEYFGLGVEHILLGIDHLLFVLALLLITRGGWALVKTVTAFTVAHSITLVAATLGLVHVAVAPVEAIIALSIVFVATEIVHSRRGQNGITARAPWVVAFIFGLLHGFGFAGALSEVGLPQGHIPLALLFFNIGVEVGQLIFVTAVLSVIALGRSVRIGYPRWLPLVPAYAIGTLAMFWVMQRVATF